jgi:hypothetical protein
VLRSRWKVRVRSPDQRLVGAGDDLDGLGLVAVPGHRPQLGAIDADHVRQRVRVALVALGPRGAVPLLEPGRLPRVDRVDAVAGRDQRLHPWTPVGLDPDHHLPGLQVLTAVPGDESVQLRDALHALRQSGGGQLEARLVLHLDIVVVFSPVVADEQQQSSQPLSRIQCLQPAEGTARSLMDQVLTPNHPAGTPSHQQSGLPADQQGHGLTPELDCFRLRKCSPAGGYGTESLRPGWSH